MKPLILSLLLVAVASARQNPDGAILSRQPVTLPETTLAAMERRSPDIRKVLAGVVLESITYSSGGLRVRGYLASPREPGRYPCVVYNRGGNREFGAWTDERAAWTLGKIASWGYVVAASQYRGTAGGEGREEFGGADLDDSFNLLPVLAGEERADTSRVGLYGWSRGGMMTYLALKRSCRFRAAVVGSGLADLFESASSRPGMDSGVFAELIPGYERSRDSALVSRSARYWPELLCKTTPLLVMHGSADWRVSPAPVLDLVGGLYRSRHPLRFVLLEGGQHSLVEHSAEVDRLSRDFLDRYVRDRTPWPDLVPHGN